MFRSSSLLSSKFLSSMPSGRFLSKLNHTSLWFIRTLSITHPLRFVANKPAYKPLVLHHKSEPNKTHSFENLCQTRTFDFGPTRYFLDVIRSNKTDKILFRLIEYRKDSGRKHMLVAIAAARSLLQRLKDGCTVIRSHEGRMQRWDQPSDVLFTKNFTSSSKEYIVQVQVSGPETRHLGHMILTIKCRALDNNIQSSIMISSLCAIRLLENFDGILQDYELKIVGPQAGSTGLIDTPTLARREATKLDYVHKAPKPPKLDYVHKAPETPKLAYVHKAPKAPKLAYVYKGPKAPKLAYVHKAPKAPKLDYIPEVPKTKEIAAQLQVASKTEIKPNFVEAKNRDSDRGQQEEACEQGEILEVQVNQGWPLKLGLGLLSIVIMLRCSYEWLSLSLILYRIKF